MVRRDRVGVRTKVAAALMALGAGVYVTVAGPSSADVTAVTGSAFGVSIQNITLGGGAQPPVGPDPVVTLPAGGSATPLTATSPSELVGAGPATFFSSGQVDVSTQGTTGPTGSVTSTATVNDISTAGGGQLNATSASSTCTASEAGVSASTAIADGVVNTVTDADGNVTATQPVPTNPPVGLAINGTVVAGASLESFTYIFNEQTTNPDGSITVTAVHLHLAGPFAKGDLFVGQSVCGVTAAAPTTTTSSTLVPSSTTTSSTLVPSSTTTSSTLVPSSTTTSSTLVPSSTTTTSVPPGVITTGGGGTVIGGGTVSGGGNALVRTGAGTARMTGLAALALFLGFCLVRAARYRRYAAPWNRRGRW